MDGPAEELAALALGYFRREQMEDALALARASVRCAEVLELPLVAGESWQLMGRVHGYRSEPKLGEHAFEEASRCFESSGEPDRANGARLRSSFLAFEAGDHEVARAIVDSIQSSDSASQRHRGIALGYAGNFARWEGDYELARGRYQEARQLLGAEGGDSIFEGAFILDTALVDLLEDKRSAARSTTELVRQRVDELDDPLLRALFTHCDLLCAASSHDRERARSAQKSYGGSGAGAEFLRKCHAIAAMYAEGANRSELAGELEQLEQDVPAHQHAHLSVRILRGWIGTVEQNPNRLFMYPSKFEAHLGSRRVVTFPADSPTWRILRQLCTAASEDAGPCTAEELVASGWPGESIKPKAARNRLHVALAWLRRHGFRDAILRYPAGYGLRPDIEVRA